METLLVLNALDFQLLNIFRKLIESRELKVALGQLRHILMRQSDGNSS
jgi:hypothetical protein